MEKLSGSVVDEHDARWNKWYGCGHITTPFHKKGDCPHKSKPCWGSPEVLTTPLVLLASAAENVAIVESEILGEKVKVGLDSMSSLSFLSSRLVEKLPDVVKEKRSSVTLVTAVVKVSLEVN